MTTSYTLTPGYAEGKRQECTPKDLRDLARIINLDDLRKKAEAYGILEFVTPDELGELVDCYYPLPSEDATCIWIGNGILQSASGSNKWRQAKEIMRQAFSALFLDAAFKRGWAVQLEIT